MPSRDIENLFTNFSTAWEKSIRANNGFYIALQFLNSKEKGSRGSRASILYLRDAFAACGILLSVLGVRAGSRAHTISKCLKEVGVKNELPFDDWRRHIVDELPDLWWGVTKKQVLLDERELGTMDRPLANAENWMLHLEDTDNLRRLLSLPRSVRHYLVEVIIWLADLLVLKVVGYQGFYFNRLTSKTEIVPWRKDSGELRG